MGLYLCLLAYGTSFDIITDPLFHSDPPVVLLDFLYRFVSSWVSGSWGIVCLTNYGSFYFLHIQNDDLSFWSMKYTDLLW